MRAIVQRVVLCGCLASAGCGVVVDQAGHTRAKADGPTPEMVNCFKIVGDWEDQPSDPRRSLLERAVQEIVSYQIFMKQLCTAENTPIELYRKRGISGGTAGPDRVSFGDDSKDEIDLLYTLAHELGHVLVYRDPTIGASFHADRGIQGEGLVPTYPNSQRWDIYEDLPETLGIHIAGEFKYFGNYTKYYTRTRSTGFFILCEREAFAEHCRFARQVVGPKTPMSSNVVPQGLQQDDCVERCTGDAYTACMTIHRNTPSRSGWIYKGDVQQSSWFEGGVAGLLGTDRCNETGLRCSSAHFSCYKRCGCSADARDSDRRIPKSALDQTKAEHPDKLLYVFIDTSRRWLFLYDHRGEKVMDFRTAVGQNGTTTPGKYQLSEICIDEQYCETYTPENYPQDEHPDLYALKPSYYGGHSMFIDACGLEQADREAICQRQVAPPAGEGDAATASVFSEPPLVCLQDEAAVLPDDWQAQVHEVNCTTSIEYNNRNYHLDLQSRSFAHPGPYGIMWGRLEHLEHGRTQRGIHGTNERAILGLAETHGCVRAYNHDVWRLYRHILRTLDDRGQKDNLQAVLITIASFF